MADDQSPAITEVENSLAVIEECKTSSATDVDKSRTASGMDSVGAALIHPPELEKKPAKKVDLVKERWLRVRAMAYSHMSTQHLLPFFTDREKRALAEDIDKLSPLALWQKVRGGSDRQAAIGISVAIGEFHYLVGADLLKQFGETPYAPPSDRGPALEDAIEEGGLVIVEGLRDVYWKTNSLDIDWFKKKQSWSFLLQLASKALRNFPLAANEFLGDNCLKPDSIKTVKLRLVKLEGLPEDLKALIVPSGARQYRLNLQPAKIRIFSEQHQVGEGRQE